MKRLPERVRILPGFAKRLFQRVVIVGLSIIMQITVFVAMLYWFRDQNDWLDMLLVLISALAVLVIISKNTNPAYKIAWVIPILIFPVFGGMMYLMLGGNRLSPRQKRKMNSVERTMRLRQPDNDEVAAELKEASVPAYMQSAYMKAVAGCPLFKNTQTRYFSLGDDAFPVMLEELSKAEHYIFIEYFIIGKGEMWNAILEILKEKAAEGVDVRVMYDDFGSITLLPSGYRQELESMGIQACVYAPFIPIVSSRLNNRDHRKFMIIDGKVGFTGGINLADEYINRRERFGHWKDCAVMLRGDAVWSMTVMFLSLWEYTYGREKHLLSLIPPEMNLSAQGFVQPYTDNPLDDEPVGASVYLNLISHATKSICIMTPYLIIDYEMTRALTNAAKTGVDVKIITPHVPDKWYVHALTQAHYGELLKGGVRIYEYTPGFIHSKVFVVDGEYATVGTVNLDYRSLYLHFEDGVWMYHTDCILDVQKDFDETLTVSHEITLEAWSATKAPKRLLQALLRLLSPLM